MTRAQRENFTPTDPTEFVADTIASGWDTATTWLSQVPGEAVDFISDSPEFAADAVSSAIDEIRDVYDSATQTFNLITNVIETPCEDKWNVIIETALPAAGSSLWLLLTPNPGEMLEEYLSPKGSRKAGRGGKDTRNKYRRKGKSGKIRRRWPALPHVDSLIADRLPGAQAIQGRDIGFGQRFLFTGIDLADRVLWYFLVLDVAENFFTKWSSGIMESRFCSRSFDYLIAGDLAGVPFDIIGAGFDHQENWSYSAFKGAIHAFEPAINFQTNITGNCNFSARVTWPEPVKSVFTEVQVTVLRFRNSDLIDSISFPVDVQEGDTSVDVGGSVPLEEHNQVTFSFGGFNTDPEPDFLASGSLLAFGEPTP